MGKKFNYTSQVRARLRKLSVHYHMTHVVKVDNLTDHEEIGNLHFSEDYISLYIYRKTTYYFKMCAINYESTAYCLTKFIQILIPETKRGTIFKFYQISFSYYLVMTELLDFESS